VSVKAVIYSDPDPGVRATEVFNIIRMVGETDGAKTNKMGGSFSLVYNKSSKTLNLRLGRGPCKKQGNLLCSDTNPDNTNFFTHRFPWGHAYYSGAFLRSFSALGIRGRIMVEYIK
jgi:hypothetical protein